jgi:methylene-fatty-acyl-phospholipid synthase
MTLWSLLVAAGALSLERICYAWVWHKPDAFLQLCGKPIMAAFDEPVDVLRNLFVRFKALQLSVFLYWCYLHGHGAVIVPGGADLCLWIGSILIVGGQVLNMQVFLRLGKIGVFYGNRLGYHVPWSRGFPFSLVRHPQYVGAVLSVWGFFMTTSFPYDDWYLLPTLQTGQYLVGAYLEQ